MVGRPVGSADQWAHPWLPPSSCNLPRSFLLHCHVSSLMLCRFDALVGPPVHVMPAWRRDWTALLLIGSKGVIALYFQPKT